ncbi:hypothetical protein RE628_19935 [Paenibacillus sp. D2_2]|uniref:hypothetical protein n=1 Tax=Paenibacillus sp. D2_2 TaxID=3073092 RepID=UPI00281679C1|nr:hypothetical protein [Paenibacillus sp. D2_2]WMT39655.1 hypothetical protein RE628_19935 [Paenibacillus sp. D2_2]
MTVIGMVIGAIILFLSVYLIGPYGVGIFLVILFGIVFSTYQRNKQIYEDIKKIREKLGLLREDEKIQQGIDEGLQAFEKKEDHPEIISEINKEIEEELEKYMFDNNIETIEKNNEKK